MTLAMASLHHKCSGYATGFWGGGGGGGVACEKTWTDQ